MGNSNKRRKDMVLPTPPRHAATPEDLLGVYLADEAWLRRLARSLIADESRANELVQLVLTQALHHKPQHLKAWATTVMRRAVTHIRISEWRRSKREKAVSREERVAPGTPEADRQDTRTKLAALVAEMEPRYREVIALHFFEELSSEEVAAKMKIPVATVRTRLQRALAQMRQKLRTHYGEPTKWVFAMAPLAGLELGAISGVSMPKSKANKAATAKLGGYGAIGIAAALLLGVSAMLLIALPSTDGDSRDTASSSELREDALDRAPLETPEAKQMRIAVESSVEEKDENSSAESLEDPDAKGIQLATLSGLPGETALPTNMKGSVFVGRDGAKVNMDRVSGNSGAGAKDLFKAARKASKNKK